jgi:hypothetical protein
MKVGFVFTHNMRNVLIVIFLTNSFLFAQSKEDDLKEANRVSDLFFGKVLNSCNWGMVLSNVIHGIDSLYIQRKGDIIGFNWCFSYKGFSGNTYRYEAFLTKEKASIWIEWRKSSPHHRACLPTGIIPLKD